MAEHATAIQFRDQTDVNSGPIPDGGIFGMAIRLRQMAMSHPCWKHPLFGTLADCRLDVDCTSRLLANYDHHASALRRLLLKAATIMPEEAVGYVLENVRNEYGNGNPEWRHQLQLQDLAFRAGVSRDKFETTPVRPEIKSYTRQVTPLYYPKRQTAVAPHLRPAIAGGAIAATEILALREFEYLQKAFSHTGLADHIWFNHVTIEAEHSEESMDLALYFIDRHGALKEVENGMQGVLDANVTLYDGLLATLAHRL